jgi:hypothetical protein
MTGKARIQAEMRWITVTDQLGNAALRLFAAIQITQTKQPGIVLAAVPDLQRAIEAWCELQEVELEPQCDGVPDP